MLTQAYEAFLIEVGLYGNILTLDYTKFGILASDLTWFKSLWEFSDYLKVSVVLGGKYHIQPVRRDDQALMFLFYLAGYTGNELERLNRVRKLKCLLHLSDILKCDGKSLRDGVLGRDYFNSLTHKFPLERPT